MPNNIVPVYPLDPTGQLASNLILNESQILTASNGINYHFLVPINGPFFENSLVVTLTNPTTNEVTVLSKGIDFYPSHWFISASRACANSIYGSITFLDKTLNGIIKLRYQTIGGDWTIDSSEIATVLADTLHNPRITAWEEVVDYPFAFPPIPHQWNLVDMVGMSDVVDTLSAINNSIIEQTASSTQSSIVVATATLETYSPTAGTIVAGDTLLTALQKIGGNIANEITRATTAEGLLVPKTTTVNGKALSTNITLSKSDVGLGNVDNTSDVNKPVSTAQATAIALKANIASPTFTGTVSGITKSMVGLGNVDNTSDANKPVSTAQATAINTAIDQAVLLVGSSTEISSTIQTALNLKANLDSPALSGIPSAPTAAVNTNTTQVATTAFVNAEIANDAPSKTGTGASGTWGISITGNAATATKLATARTIGGVSFDGSADINLPGVNAAGTQNTSGSAASLTNTRSIAITGDAAWAVNFNGSANASAILTLSASGVAVGTYRSVTVNAKGLVTAGTNPTTISGYGITDAYTKTEVDGLITGLDFRASVRVVSTSNITLSATQTIDGVSVVVGDRVLVAGQTTASQNGIYVVSAGAWVRSSDADNTPANEVTAGMYTFVSEGTTYADSGWVLTTNDNIVLGTTELVFTQFNGLGQITAGNGLTKTGNVINAVGTAGRIIANADTIDLATVTQSTGASFVKLTLDAYGRVSGNSAVALSDLTTLGASTLSLGTTDGLALTTNGSNGSATTAAKSDHTHPFPTKVNLGATTLGSNLFTITNPSAVTFPRFNADNSVTSLSAADFRSAIGAGVGGGDFSSNTATSVDGEIVLFNGTSGKSGKRATTTGLLKATSGVMSAAVAGTDFIAPSGALGTPSSGTLTNCTFPTLNQNTTGNAATVTTNANLTGEVTSVGNTTTVTNAAVIGKVLTGYASGAGAVAATDTILQAINKLNGNDGLKANIADTYTKAEIDSQLQGLKPKASVLAASTANIALNTATATLDGVALVAGSRVLLKNQSTASQNGIYTNLTTTNWIRAVDADVNSELVSAFVFVEQGTVNKDSAWVQTADNIVLGTTNLIWVQFAGAGAYQSIITGGASTITGTDLTVSRGLVSDSNGKVAVSAVTSTELGYVSGVTSAIQTQIGTKANIASPVFTGNVTGLGIATGTSFNSITGLSSTNPAAAGTVGPGSLFTAARADHVHPLQTTITGNAATATKLAAAITIGGVSFDGSASINLPGVNTAGNQNTTGSSASCTGNAATVTNGVYTNTINYGTSINSQTGTSYTTVFSDAASVGNPTAMVLMNNAAAQTVTIPPNASVAYPIGATLQITQMGEGKVTIAPGVGVTINSANNHKSIGIQYGVVSLLQTSLNVWLLVGSLIE